MAAPRLEEIFDLERFPLDRLEQPEGRVLVARGRGALAARGLFNLEGLVRPSAIAACAGELARPFAEQAFSHRRSHNVYFLDAVPGLPSGHGALARFETANHTLCADQIPESLVCRLYEWPPLARFLAAVMDKPALHTMADPLARANVMAYGAGEALNWHFDRSAFTTTLLIQAPEAGGRFQYRPGLRSDDDPNHDGVARFLAGEDRGCETLALTAGTLNVFKGKNTLHRVTPVEGGRRRIIAVYSYYERPGVMFSEAERVGFYGRAG